MRYYATVGQNSCNVDETGKGPAFGEIEMKEARPCGEDTLLYVALEDGTWGLDDSQLASKSRAWRDSELNRADIELNKAQDGDGTGTVKAWREYRKTLRAWPSTESFPNSYPTAPDYIE